MKSAHTPKDLGALIRLHRFHRDGVQWRRAPEESRDAVEHPGERQSIRLAPLYDVVTTSLYGVTNPRTYLTKYDRTLALNLHKSRSYPDRTTLLAFGRDHCGVARPEEVLERIADALATTLKENRGRVPAELWEGLNTEW